MQDRSLLTQAELTFIQTLQEQPEANQAKPNLLVDAGGQIKALLAHCAAHEQLTIEAHIANQRLTFTAHLIEDARNEQHLELGTPQIFDEGPATRFWRLPLNPPAALRRRNAKPCNLWVHELSMNGLLVEQRTKRLAPEHFNLFLPLAGDEPIAIEGTFVRKTADGLLAYRLEPLDKHGSERLQQFIFQQHRALHAQTTPG